MTGKLVKWYKRMSFWNMALMVIAPLTASGEIAVYFADGKQLWHWIIGIAGALSIYIKTFFRDDNNNGIVDTFEK